MPYNFADSFHTKKLIFFKRSAILDGNRPFCVFEQPFGGFEPEVTYNDHLTYRLIGKHVVDFLLVLIYELFR